MKIWKEDQGKNLLYSSFLVKMIFITDFSSKFYHILRKATLYNASGQLFLLDITKCSISISLWEYLLQMRE